MSFKTSGKNIKKGGSLNPADDKSQKDYRFIQFCNGCNINRTTS